MAVKEGLLRTHSPLTGPVRRGDSCDSCDSSAPTRDDKLPRMRRLFEDDALRMPRSFFLSPTRRIIHRRRSHPSHALSVLLFPPALVSVTHPLSYSPGSAPGRDFDPAWPVPQHHVKLALIALLLDALTTDCLENCRQASGFSLSSTPDQAVSHETTPADLPSHSPSPAIQLTPPPRRRMPLPACLHTGLGPVVEGVWVGGTAPTQSWCRWRF